MPHFDFQFFKSLDIFQDLSPNELEKIARIVHPMKTREGEEFIRVDEPAETFYVILSGNYMVYFKDGRAFTLHYKGDIVGWSTVVTPFRYVGTVVALTDGDVLTLSGQDFRRLIQQNAVLGGKIMKRIYTVMRERMPFFADDKT